MWENCSKRRLPIRFVHLGSVTSRMFLPCFVFLCFKRGWLSPAHPLVKRKSTIWVRKTTCLVGSAKQMASFWCFPLPLFIAEQCRSSVLCMTGHCCQGIFIQTGVCAAMHVCPCLLYSSCKHVEWGKTLTESQFSLLKSQEKVLFLVNH